MQALSGIDAWKIVRRDGAKHMGFGASIICVNVVCNQALICWDHSCLAF